MQCMTMSGGGGALSTSNRLHQLYERWPPPGPIEQERR